MNKSSENVKIGNYSIERIAIHRIHKISVLVPKKVAGNDDRDWVDKGIRGLEIGVSILGLLGALATGSTGEVSGSTSRQQAWDC